MSAARVRRRAELTFRQNVHHGRHGWLRLTPAYSVRLVDDLLGGIGAGAARVIDPFSGTGTTALAAGYRGLSAVATELNPFLVWLGRVKGARYTEGDRAEVEALAREIAGRLTAGEERAAALPPLRNIERWWSAEELRFVAALRGEVAQVSPGSARDLLDLAFCRTMIALSNAAFDHPSMSFKEPAPAGARGDPPRGRARFVEIFLGDVEMLAASVLDNPAGEIRIVRGDARGLAALDPGEGPFDLLVTSPPYPNRMSYIRELRPYMYWLGFLGDARSAGELDWEAIGGTWGVATSRLLAWEPLRDEAPGGLSPILDRIRRAHAGHGDLLARYVHKYFDDMAAHVSAASRVVKHGGTACYIVGNSAFYGHLVPVEQLLGEQLREAGFSRVEARAIRKRNSKKELFEFLITASR